MKRKPPAQLGLGFAPPVRPREEELTALAARVPAGVRFGTSSWTYPGWRGFVFHEAYPSAEAFRHDSLEEYVRFPLFRTVGIDRGYYAPIPPADLEAYARTMSGDFVPTAKVWSEITAPIFPNIPRWGERAGQRNPTFLDAAHFEAHVGAPFTRAFGARRVPFVLEIPPSALELVPFTRALERFLEATADRHRFAVELRNEALLAPRYLDVLRAHGASHVFNYWERMPSLLVQRARVGAAPGGIVVLRLLLPPGLSYEAQKEAYAPFDRIVLPQPGMRADVVRIVRDAVAREQEVFVIVGNKAEGSAPHTAEALARLLVAT